MAVVYLIYTAGLTSPAEPDLCSEAIRLARILATLMPDEPEVAGLLALLLLTESRRASRTRPDGSLVLLAEQDRRRWDRALIEEGQAIVRRCLRRNQPGPYQIQAAINAVHADAPAAAQTGWLQITALYDQLIAVAPTPVVALNRAIAIGEVQGPAAALALVDELDLDNYHLLHATRADLLHRLGRDSEATAAYQRAAGMAPTPAERDFLRLGGRASRSDARRHPPPATPKTSHPSPGWLTRGHGVPAVMIAVAVASRSNQPEAGQRGRKRVGHAVIIWLQECRKISSGTGLAACTVKLRGVSGSNFVTPSGVCTWSERGLTE